MGGVDWSDGCVVFQRDHSELENWGDRNLMKLSSRKCEVLHTVRNKLIHQNILRGGQLENSFADNNVEMPNQFLSRNVPLQQRGQKPDGLP